MQRKRKPKKEVKHVENEEIEKEVKASEEEGFKTPVMSDNELDTPENVPKHQIPILNTALIPRKKYPNGTNVTKIGNSSA